MIARPIRFVPLVLLALCACPGKKAATLFPESVGPGESVRIQVASASLDSASHLRVTIAGEPATIVRVVSPDLLEVIVPRLTAQADAPVTVFSDDDPVGTGKLHVLDAAARRLVFTVDGDAYSIAHAAPSGDAPTGHVRDTGERLSIDVVTIQGVLIHSATILDPSITPEERFVPAAGAKTSAQGGLRKVPGPKAFALTIPATGQKVSIRVYHVPAGIDVLTDEGRAMRSLLDTLEVQD